MKEKRRIMAEKEKGRSRKKNDVRGAEKINQSTIKSGVHMEDYNCI